ncbi:autophagy-related protein 101-like [Styela clava]|uniref:autophagy-related protein 101-like n=1 Tax=Styela clava TaxID=7725 RepID=UPI001939E1CC|nr:autophagy-related protein 101-like [Styela clava]
MNAKSHSLEILVESRQVEEAVLSIFHSIILHRSTGKFSYKREGTYSVGTIGMEDINCDFIDFTYVRVSSETLANVVSKHVSIFGEDLRKKRAELSASATTISGTITIEFYQKRRNRWPFPDESIPWEIWNLVITEKLLTTESERQVAQENIGSRLAEKIFCVTEAMNRHDFVPKMPTQSDVDLVFDTSFPDIQPYLFKITHRINSDSNINPPVSASVGSTVKRMFR